MNGYVAYSLCVLPSVNFFLLGVSACPADGWTRQYQRSCSEGHELVDQEECDDYGREDLQGGPCGSTGLQTKYPILFLVLVYFLSGMRIRIMNSTVRLVIFFHISRHRCDRSHYLPPNERIYFRTSTCFRKQERERKFEQTQTRFPPRTQA